MMVPARFKVTKLAALGNRDAAFGGVGEFELQRFETKIDKFRLAKAPTGPRTPSTSQC